MRNQKGNSPERSLQGDIEEALSTSCRVVKARNLQLGDQIRRKGSPIVWKDTKTGALVRVTTQVVQLELVGAKVLIRCSGWADLLEYPVNRRLKIIPREAKRVGVL